MGKQSAGITSRGIVSSYLLWCFLITRVLCAPTKCNYLHYHYFLLFYIYLNLTRSKGVKSTREKSGVETTPTKNKYLLSLQECTSQQPRTKGLKLLFICNCPLGVGGADCLQQHNMAAVKATRTVSRRILDEATELLTPVQQDWLLLQLARNTPVGYEA